MTSLQYLNREMHYAGGRRGTHETRKPDLQKVSREARIAARKQQFRTRVRPASESAQWFAEGLRLSEDRLRAVTQRAAACVRRHPLSAAVTSLTAGLFLGLLLRRR